MQRPDGFRSLAELLRPPVDEHVEPHEHVADLVQTVPQETAADVHDLLRDARMFRAHLRDALGRCVERLLERIARDVLERECAIAPPDINRIVETALKQATPEVPFTVRVSDVDVSRLQDSAFAVEADARMSRGDVALIVADGVISSTLDLRLNDAIAEALSVMHDR